MALLYVLDELCYRVWSMVYKIDAFLVVLCQLFSQPGKRIPIVCKTRGAVLIIRCQARPRLLGCSGPY